MHGQSSLELASEDEAVAQRLGYFMPPPNAGFPDAARVWAEAATVLDLAVGAQVGMSAPTDPQARSYYDGQLAHRKSRSRSRSRSRKPAAQSAGAAAAPPALRPSVATDGGGMDDSPAEPALPAQSLRGDSWFARVAAWTTRVSGSIALHGWDLALKTRRRVFWWYFVLLILFLGGAWAKFLGRSNDCGLVAYLDHYGRATWRYGICRVEGTVLVLASIALSAVALLAAVFCAMFLPDLSCRTVVPYFATVAHLGLALAIFGGWLGGFAWGLMTESTFLMNRLRDALVFPGTLAASLHTGVRVPVALEAIVLAIATVIPAIGHFGHLVDMSHDRFHDYLRAEGLPNHAPNAWAYFVVPLLAAMWITVYWMISVAFYGGLASRTGLTARAIGPGASLAAPPPKSPSVDLRGTLHLAGWMVWVVMVASIAVLVAAGGPTFPWVTVDDVAVVSLLFAILSTAIVRLSSTLALEARDRLILQILPPDAAKVLLRRIANADDDDGMAEQTSGAEERGAKGPLRDIREEEQGKPETAGADASGPDRQGQLSSGASRSGETGKGGRPGPGLQHIGGSSSRTGASGAEAGRSVRGRTRGPQGSGPGRAPAQLPAAFKLHAQDVTFMAVGVPGLDRLSRAPFPDQAAALLHELHCVAEGAVEGIPGANKVEILGSQATLVVALNLRSAVRDHRPAALALARKLFAAAMGLQAWEGSGLTPACKVAISTGSATAVVLGRAQPVLSVLGEAATDVAMLFERTAVGWMSVSLKSMVGDPVAQGFICHESYVRGIGIQAFYQVQLSAPGSVPGM